jgi:hypothetical protein
VVIGDHTGAGTGNSYTITNDNTGTTAYGTLVVGKGGTLTYGTAASTNYYLKLGGSVTIHRGGTLSLGTSGTPIPSTSTAVLEMNVGSDRQYFVTVKNGGTLNFYGASKTEQTKLTADAAAAATSLTLGSTTGWAANDLLCLASTTRTASESEQVTISSVTDSTHVAVGALTNAHLGTSPRQAEVINLTRNVKFRGISTTLGTYITTQATAVFAAQYAEFRYLSLATLTPGGGIDAFTTTGSFTMTYCSIYDTINGAVNLGNSSVSGTYDNITFSNNVMYNCNIAGSTGCRTLSINFPSLPGNSIVCQNNVVMKTAGGVASASGCIFLGQYALQGCTITGNVVTSCIGATAGVGWVLNDTTSVSVKSFSSNASHSNQSFGFQITGGGAAGGVLTMGSFTSWRNNGSAGLAIGLTGGFPAKLIFDTWTFFGNANANIATTGSTEFSQAVFISPTVNSDSTTTTAVGLSFGSGSGEVFIFSGSFGATVAHTTGDISVASSFSNHRVYAFNTAFASTTEVSGISSAGSPLFTVRSNQHDQSSTTFKAYHRAGTILSDTSTRHTASGYSWKLTPSASTNKLILPGPSTFDTFKRAVVANVAVTVTAYVQKDGSYNGNAARLVVIGGVTPGVSTDQTASMTVASGNWEQLSVTVTPTADGVIEFYLDCDGTAGNIYVDDLNVSQTGIPSSKTMDYPGRGLPADGIAATETSRVLANVGMAGGMLS